MLQDLAALRRFLRLCVAHSTVRHWRSVLEASYEIFRLQPPHENFGKRLVNMPKLYFRDGP